LTEQTETKSKNLRDISTRLGHKESALRDCLYSVLFDAVTQDGKAQSLKVLDIGCGRGELMGLLRDQGHTCVGVDVEPDCVSLASEFGATHVGTFGTLQMLPLNDDFQGSVDVAVSSHVLEHVDSPLDCLRQARDVEANRYVFAVPNVLRSISLVRAVTGSPRADHPTHVFGWTRPEFEALLNRAGFDLIAWHCDRVTINPLAGKIGTQVTRLLSPLETGLLPRLFPMLSSSLIAECRPTNES